MSSLEPADQKLGSLWRRRAVKRHERGGTAERNEIRAPSVWSDRGYLNPVDATVDGLFETLQVHDCTEPGMCEIRMTWEMEFYRAEW